MKYQWTKLLVASSRCAELIPQQLVSVKSGLQHFVIEMYTTPCYTSTIRSYKYRGRFPDLGPMLSVHPVPTSSACQIGCTVIYNRKLLAALQETSS